ncbi:MAG TPA: YciI family protein [Acidimicrobiales bacterium]|nr:YciI family protein [Acidimicrobiales bacterium]
MAKFIVSYGASAMDHIPDEDMPAVADAAHAVVEEILNAGVYVLAGGLENRSSSIVATDGTVTDGPGPEAIGGLTIVDVSSREEALKWAAKIAVACRCAQEVWEIGFDPELEAMIDQAGGRS